LSSLFSSRPRSWTTFKTAWISIQRTYVKGPVWSVLEIEVHWSVCCLQVSLLTKHNLAVLRTLPSAPILGRTSRVFVGHEWEMWWWRRAINGEARRWWHCWITMQFYDIAHGNK
jgi:hypothetical protein